MWQYNAFHVIIYVLHHTGLTIYVAYVSLYCCPLNRLLMLLKRLLMTKIREFAFEKRRSIWINLIKWEWRRDCRQESTTSVYSGFDKPYRARSAPTFIVARQWLTRHEPRRDLFRAPNVSWWSGPAGDCYLSAVSSSVFCTAAFRRNLWRLLNCLQMHMRYDRAHWCDHFG